MTGAVESDPAARPVLRLHRHHRAAGAALQRIPATGAVTGVDFEQRTP
jgi:hypothetical protein